MLPKVSNGEPESGGRHFMYLFIVYRGKEKKCGSQKVCDDAESSTLRGHLIPFFPQCSHTGHCVEASTYTLKPFGNVCLGIMQMKHVAVFFKLLFRGCFLSIGFVFNSFEVF